VWERWTLANVREVKKLRCVRLEILVSLFAQPLRTPPPSADTPSVPSGPSRLYYGGRLLEAGHDVSFLARRDLSALQTDGLTIESVDGDCKFPSVAAFGTPAELRAAASGGFNPHPSSQTLNSEPQIPNLQLLTLHFKSHALNPKPSIFPAPGPRPCLLPPTVPPAT